MECSSEEPLLEKLKVGGQRSSWQSRLEGRVRQLRAVFAPGRAVDEPPEEAQLRDLQEKLDHKDRCDVQFSFSLRTARRVEEGMQVHLVLKFCYPNRIIKDILEVEPPPEGPEGEDHLRERGGERRIFPYCIFNAVEETQLGWTFRRHKDESGQKVVEERVELLVTLTYVTYRKYFPFVLELLPLKVGTDGEGKTGLINLVPKTLRDPRTGAETSVPDARLGVFTKRTSPLTIGGSDFDSLAENVVVRSCVRDLSAETLNSRHGIMTRVYVAIFFQTSTIGNFVRFLVLPTLLLHVSTFLPVMDIGDMVQAWGEEKYTLILAGGPSYRRIAVRAWPGCRGAEVYTDGVASSQQYLCIAACIPKNLLALVLADLAVLWVLQAGKELSMAEHVIIAHICYFCLMCFFVGYRIDRKQMGPHTQEPYYEEIMLMNIVVTVLTVAYVARCFRDFVAIAGSIREKLKPIDRNYNMGLFTRIEQEI